MKKFSNNNNNQKKCNKVYLILSLLNVNFNCINFLVREFFVDHENKVLISKMLDITKNKG
jgi:hypothetical protein